MSDPADRSAAATSADHPLFGGGRRVPLVGIVGGVASGKSVVAARLAELGAGVLDADRAGHDVLRDPEVEATARQQWGDSIFGADGRIDRRKLGAIVFGDAPEARRQRRVLEGLTHPRIGGTLREQAAAMLGSAEIKAIVIDAPLMLEAGWGQLCDQILFIDAPAAVRLERAVARGWTSEEFQAREAAQQDLDSKRAQADAVIDNSGTMPETRAQVDRWWHALWESSGKR